MPSHDAALSDAVIDTARKPDHGHSTGEYVKAT